MYRDAIITRPVRASRAPAIRCWDCRIEICINIAPIHISLRRSSGKSISLHGKPASYIGHGSHLSLLGDGHRTNLHARPKTSTAAKHIDLLQCRPGAAQQLHVLRASDGRLAAKLQLQLRDGQLWRWRPVETGKLHFFRCIVTDMLAIWIWNTNEPIIYKFIF